MPSGRNITPFSALPPIKTVKKKIRPSSAAANLQTHPSYTTGLYDNVLRPSTASAGGFNSLGPRPHTQAGGPRSHWQAKTDVKNDDAKKENVKHPRRLTLGTVEGIADSDSAIRTGYSQLSVAYQLKSKVRNEIVHTKHTFYIFLNETKKNILKDISIIS